MGEDTSYVSLNIERYNKLYDASKRAVDGWRPISEYDREKYDWVLLKFIDGPFESIPTVGELRSDGIWYSREDAKIPYNITHFFDMQQLDNI